MKQKVLIVGAGPTGLTAAVELARRGVIARVIDEKAEASTLSRAVGINARTLQLLSESGVTEDLIRAGIKIREGLFHIAEKPAFSLKLDSAAGPFNFLLALPQDKTEEILRSKFEDYGGTIEFGKRFLGVEANEPDRVEFAIVNVGTEVVEKGWVTCLLGADGIRSKVRESSGIDFKGIELEDKWSILDFDSRSWPHEKELCLFLYEGGRVCLVIPIGDARYRAVTDRPNAIDHIPSTLTVDNVRREGDFMIWVKQATTYNNGNVSIAGDAAHSHSPVGGRGMNLGIADACSFAELLDAEQLESYSSERHKAGRRIIQTTERARRLITSTMPGKLAVLKYLTPHLLRFNSVQKRIARFALDTPRQ